MIKVIKHGTKKTAECKHCGCIFEYEDEDVQRKRVKNNEYDIFVKCPDCGYRVDKKWD